MWTCHLNMTISGWQQEGQWAQEQACKFSMNGTVELSVLQYLIHRPSQEGRNHFTSASQGRQTERYITCRPECYILITGPHVEFSCETFLPLCETFLLPGSGHNSKIHMAGMKEAQPLTLSSSVPLCGPVAVDLLGTPPQDAVQRLLCLSLSSAHCPAYSLLLYFNLWKLISACFLGIYANAGDVGSIPGSGRSPKQGNGNPHHYPS